MTNDLFSDHKATIRAELATRAWAGETMTYGQAAALVSRTPLGLGKILDLMKSEEAASNNLILVAS